MFIPSISLQSTAVVKYFGLGLAVVTLAGCASKLDDVANSDAPTMKHIYEQGTGTDSASLEERKVMLLRRPATYADDLQVGLPPHPERLDHLYPRLPNPDLIMYVRPHAVGRSGAPIPAYITRFTMYERQPYALPGESLESLRIDHRDRHDAIIQKYDEAQLNKKRVPASSQRAH